VWMVIWLAVAGFLLLGVVTLVAAVGSGRLARAEEAEADAWNRAVLEGRRASLPRPGTAHTDGALRSAGRPDRARL
jgi:hypothetical protein